MTLVEVSVAATLTVMVMGASLSICIYGVSGFFKNQAKVDSESASQLAIRKIAIELREAMSVTVDSNGNGLNYVKGTADSSGNLVIPLATDGVTRRIAVSGTTITITSGTITRTLIRNVIMTDPTNNNAAYQMFTTNGSGITRFLNVMLVIQAQDSPYKVSTSRSRETIYLRNVPESIR